jgi:hypothetical protein
MIGLPGTVLKRCGYVGANINLFTDDNKACSLAAARLEFERSSRLAGRLMARASGADLRKSGQ